MRDLARAQEQRRRLLSRGAELALERNEAVRIRTGNAQIELQILRPAGLIQDLVELILAVEGEAADPELAIGARGSTPRDFTGFMK